MYEKLYSARTWTSHLCEVKLYVILCDPGSIFALPISFLSVALFIGALYDEGYAAATIPVCVAAVFRQQILNWRAVLVKLRAWESMLSRGAKRDSEESDRMLPITNVMIRFRSQFRCSCLVSSL